MGMGYEMELMCNGDGKMFRRWRGGALGSVGYWGAKSGGEVPFGD